jgi:hypothetical protein
MPSNNKNQSGVALLIFIILVALAAITYYFSTLSSAELKINRQQQTRLILKQAKQALIAHAVTHADQPGDAGEFGDLPCPDANSAINTEGVQDPSCGNDDAVSDLGYLPWKTLGIDALKDYSGTCLYYAVSPSYKITSNVVMLNEDTNGLIQIVDSTGAVISGATADTRPVAVVLAAGAALAGQNRTPDSTTICGLDYNNISAYLDNDGTTDNSIATTADNVIRKFVGASPGSENKPQPVNDQLITISRADIWKAILKRRDFKTKINDLTQALALCLVDYAADNTGRRLPWPAPMDLSVKGYGVNNSYSDVAGYAGRFPYKVANSSAVLTEVNAPPSTHPPSVLFDVVVNITPPSPACNSLTVADGTTVNLQDLTSEYGKLWQNWKDHFFYAPSKAYEPASGAPPTSCATCITVGGTPYAGVVFYSGSALSGIGQKRDAPPPPPPLPPYPNPTQPPASDNNDKADISNYLENTNDQIFKNATGTQIDTYQTSGYNVNSSGPTVDIMWCIKPDMSGIVQC